MSTNDFIDKLEHELRLASRRRVRLELARVPRAPTGTVALVVAVIVCAAVSVPLLATRSSPTAVHQPPNNRPGGRGLTVGCDHTVYGQLGRDWRSTSAGTVIAGPLAWVYLRQAVNGIAIKRSHFIKALAVVNAGTEVTVSIPRSEAHRVSLDYTSVAPRSRFHLPEGASSVTLKACPNPRELDVSRGRSQFAGGFIVSGPQCAEVDIKPAGSAPTIRKYLSLGQRCPAAGFRPANIPVSKVLSGKGIGRATFGEDPGAVRSRLVQLLGHAPSRSYHAVNGCRADHDIEWPGLAVYFRHGRFIGYGYGLAYQESRMAGPEPALATLRGLRVGDPAQRGRRLYGSVFRLSAAQGGSWSVDLGHGRIFGYTSGPYDLRGPITSIDAGYVGCPALTP